MAIHRLIAALQRKPIDRTPVWLMRQAGRYLPEYRKVRQSVKDFLTLCKTPELACEVTLQPIQRYPLDAAIIFSDILTIPEGYGLGLNFVEGEGPQFQTTIKSLQDVLKLPHLDPEVELRYVMDAIRNTRGALQDKVPLIGFAGSPWTIATYMVEGKPSKQFSTIKRMRFQAPDVLHALLLHLSKTIIDYLNAQIAAGAEVVMLFDTWGGILTKEDYQHCSLHYMKFIMQGLKPNLNKEKIPVILFTKNSGAYLPELFQSGADAIGLDWLTSLKEARHLAKDTVALQGNLDPATLYGNREKIEVAVEKVLNQYGAGPGHIFNLGHGMLPDIEPEKVSILLEAVHNKSTKLNSTLAHTETNIVKLASH